MAELGLNLCFYFLFSTCPICFLFFPHPLFSCILLNKFYLVFHFVSIIGVLDSALHFTFLWLFKGPAIHIFKLNTAFIQIIFIILHVRNFEQHSSISPPPLCYIYHTPHFYLYYTLYNTPIVLL